MEPVSIYIAGSYGRRAELLEHKLDYMSKGGKCTSTWLDKPESEAENNGLGKEPATYAFRDLDDILVADAIVLFAEPDGVNARGGKHVEFGFALAHGKGCFVVGRKETVFQWLPHVEQFDTWEECCQHLLTL